MFAKIKKFIFNFIFLTLPTLLILFLFFECYFRITEPKTTKVYSRLNEDDKNNIYWQLIPDKSGYTCGEKYTTNSLGYRGPLRPYEKYSDKYRILVFGDSFMWGFGVEDSETLPYRLEGYLNNLLEDNNTEVINLGIPGFNIGRAFQWFLVNIKKFDTDMIIFIYHIGDILENDIINLDSPQSNKETPFLIKINTFFMSNSYFIRYLEPRFLELYYKFKNKKVGISDWEHSEIEKNGIFWQAAKKRFLMMKDLCQKNGIKFIIILYPNMQNFENNPAVPVHKKIVDFCRENNIICLDLLPGFRGLKASEFWATKLDFHPNAKAHDIAAKYLAETLIKNKWITQ